MPRAGDGGGSLTCFRDLKSPEAAAMACVSHRDTEAPLDTNHVSSTPVSNSQICPWAHRATGCGLWTFGLRHCHHHHSLLTSCMAQVDRGTLPEPRAGWVGGAGQLGEAVAAPTTASGALGWPGLALSWVYPAYCCKTPVTLNKTVSASQIFHTEVCFPFFLNHSCSSFLNCLQFVNILLEL